MAGRLRANEREFDGAADLPIKGILSDAEAEAKLSALRAEREAMQRRLASLPDRPKVVALQPALVARYLRVLASITEAVDARHEAEARAAIRDVIDKVTVFPPTGGRSAELEVSGYLSRLVDPSLATRGAIVGGWVVAEEGFEPPTQGL